MDTPDRFTDWMKKHGGQLFRVTALILLLAGTGFLVWDKVLGEDPNKAVVTAFEDTAGLIRAVGINTQSVKTAIKKNRREHDTNDLVVHDKLNHLVAETPATKKAATETAAKEVREAKAAEKTEAAKALELKEARAILAESGILAEAIRLAEAKKEGYDRILHSGDLDDSIER